MGCEVPKSRLFARLAPIDVDGPAVRVVEDPAFPMLELLERISGPRVKLDGARGVGFRAGYRCAVPG